ncbi:metallophosphoesterase [Rhizobium sp. AAP43]|nr:metallophosphoesterase [Rhizobium sp. AAP43]
MLGRRMFLKLAIAGLSAAMATAAYPFVEVFGKPKVTPYRLTPARWPKGLRLKIAVLADFHACDPWMTPERIGSICSEANALEADIVLLLGDYMRGLHLMTQEVAPTDWAQALSILKAPLGVHAVLGNHDYWEDPRFQKEGNGETIAEQALRSVGINILINTTLPVDKDGYRFWLAGLGDQLALRPGSRYKRPEAIGIHDLPATLASINDDAPVILMAHEPDIFPEVDDRVSLTLSGHTHNGQVNIFGWRPISASKGSARYPRGHFREEGRDLIVSGGLGCSVLPVRVGTWPEILAIELGDTA